MNLSRISDLIDQVHVRINRHLRERNLTLIITEINELPEIDADPDLLDKVFHNLLINAIKFTPDYGSIIISGRETSLNDKPALEIIVSDTGIGINPEYHERIFEKLYQIGDVAFHSSGQTKFKGGGPGLGLAIVRGIVRAHGGRVWVESKGLDEETYPGSHFHVVLPLKYEVQRGATNNGFLDPTGPLVKK